MINNLYFTLFYLEKSLNLLWFAFLFFLIHPGRGAMVGLLALTIIENFNEGIAVF